MELDHRLRRQPVRRNPTLLRGLDDHTAGLGHRRYMARRLGNRRDTQHLGLRPRSLPLGTERRCGELDNKIHQQHLHAPDHTRIQHSRQCKCSPLLPFVGLHGSQLGRRRRFDFNRWWPELVVASATTQRVPRSNLHREHQFAPLW